MSPKRIVTLMVTLIKTWPLKCLRGVFVFTLFGGAFTHAAQVIPILDLQDAPTLDGSGEDWNKLPAIEIKLHGIREGQNTNIDSVWVKAGVFTDKVYFYFTWKDDSKNIEHKPFIWSEDQSRYIQSKVLEDRLAIQFSIEGDYTTNWLSGNNFIADMWHWKAFRSNSLGLAHDKKTVVSTEKLLRSYNGSTPEGDPVYILRPSDSGDRLYKSKRYKEKVGDTMPKYLLTENPQGSVADVKAKGVWKEGMWHLEMTRQLNTHHEDDVIFNAGQKVPGGIAVFNGTGDDDHSVSDTLIFQF